MLHRSGGRDDGKHTRGHAPEDLYSFSKRGRDFVQAVARGLGDGVRNTARKLEDADLEKILQFDVFRDVIEALEREADWRPKPDVAFNLFGPLDPENKQLRAATIGAVRRGRSTARRLVANTPRRSAPNIGGAHYRTAVGVADVLRTIPSVKEIFLFGSVARGEEGPDSDVDLLVVRGAGLGDAGFRDLVYEKLAAIAELVQFPVLEIRQDALGGLPSPPDVHLLATLGEPKRWSDHGVVGGELVSLWRIDSPEDLVAARGRDAEVLTTEAGSAVLHEKLWYWRDEVARTGFRAEAIIEVSTGGNVELRLVDVGTPWFSTQREEINAQLTGQGKLVTQWSEDIEWLAFDTIVQWVEGKTGSEVVRATFSS